MLIPVSVPQNNRPVNEKRRREMCHFIDCVASARSSNIRTTAWMLCMAVAIYSAKNPAHAARAISAVENKVEKSTWEQKVSRVELNWALLCNGNVALADTARLGAQCIEGVFLRLKLRSTFKKSILITMNTSMHFKFVVCEQFYQIDWIA